MSSPSVRSPVSRAASQSRFWNSAADDRRHDQPDGEVARLEAIGRDEQ